MAFARLVRNPIINAHMPQPPDFDEQWPFDKSVPNSPMPHPYKMKMDPPFFGMRRIHFKNASVSTGFGTVSRPQPRMSGNSRAGPTQGGRLVISRSRKAEIKALFTVVDDYMTT